ncbi:MAG: site-2 protease family protein [Terriglobia bacterium]|jgi:Zn-dependent protease|nr:site-2 protease family protein [Terriglobia bacterium]
MNPHYVDYAYEAVAFLFAISVHESAHAWMAAKRGDPTAAMLGRVTLNPIKHIDIIGTIVLPIIALVSGFPMIGWAKPTPVNPRNFKNVVVDDILTSVAGPVSNFLVVIFALIVLFIIGIIGRATAAISGESVLTPISMMFFYLAEINVLLGVFNLIPLPPLDGSHVLRHALSGSALRAYDTVGTMGLFVLVFFGDKLLWLLLGPPQQFVAVSAQRLLGS